MKNNTKIIHTPIDESEIGKYYIIITEIVDFEIVRSYTLKLPLFVSANLNMIYPYYQYIFN